MLHASQIEYIFGVEELDDLIEILRQDLLDLDEE